MTDNDTPAQLSEPRRILTVCLGGYCRAPLAAAVLDQRGGQTVQVRAAGLRSKWVGQPAHPVMLAAAKEFGFDLSQHRGAQVSAEMIEWADIVLAMDRAVLDELTELAGEASRHKLRQYLGDADVPDPYGKDYGAFLLCVVLVRDGAAQHLPGFEPYRCGREED